MTNKEYVAQNHVDDLIDLVADYGDCPFCRKVGCEKFCEQEKHLSCEETIKAWMTMEHEKVGD